jgi:hypothetical protein
MLFSVCGHLFAPSVSALDSPRKQRRSETGIWPVMDELNGPPGDRPRQRT